MAADAERRRLLRVGASLVLDAVTVEVVEALTAAGVRPVVLKGPAIVQRLYDDFAFRAHEDVDLLVAPDARPLAGSTLAELGFERAASDAYADVWTRGSDGSTIDLHTSLSGLGAPAAEAWAALEEHLEPLELPGATVEVLAPPALALLVALHTAAHGPKGGKALEDLSRALERFPATTWDEAGALAARLDGSAAFVAGLGLVPEGSAVAARFATPGHPTAKVALLSTSPPPTAPGLLRLAETRGARAKAALVAREVAPPPAFMRAVYPLARRGPVGLATAYAARPFWLLRYAPSALRAVRRARRETT
jgi:hypothetical protein